MRTALVITYMMLAVGCASSTSKRPATAAQGAGDATKPTRTALAILPVAKDRYPRLAVALDHALGTAEVPRTAMVESKVSIDVVQLSIECVEASPACYAAVARSLQADQLLFARLEPGSPRGVRVVVMWTDAAGRALGQQSETYATEDEAVADAQKLVTRAVER